MPRPDPNNFNPYNHDHIERLRRNLDSWAVSRTEKNMNATDLRDASQALRLLAHLLGDKTPVTLPSNEDGFDKAFRALHDWVSERP